MYGQLITATGWTWEYIDDYMTLPRWRELREYWSTCPPIHISFEAFLASWTGQPSSSAKSPDPAASVAGAEWLMANFPVKEPAQ